MLTKVNTLTNSNERINLTIFESNGSPRSYATNLHFAGTGKCPMNNILATLGSNLNTAMRFFRQAFHEKTRCNWDDRLKTYNERVSAPKGNTRAMEDAVPFERRFFEYMPPRNSSRGLLPDGRDEVPEVVRQMREVPAQIDLTDDGPETADVGNVAAEKSDFNDLFTGTNEATGRLSVPVLAEMDGEATDSLVFDATDLTSEGLQFDFESSFAPDVTQAGQTQLATGIGEELLDLNNDKLVSTTPTNKRKHDDQGDEAPLAKKADSEYVSD